MLIVNPDILDIVDENEYFLLSHIARHMKHNRATAWPSLSTLCQMTRWGKMRVLRCIEALKKKGVLAVSSRKNANGGNASNVYELRSNLIGFTVFVTGKIEEEAPEPLYQNDTTHLYQNDTTLVSKRYHPSIKMIPEVDNNRSSIIVVEEGAQEKFEVVSENETQKAPPRCAAPPANCDTVFDPIAAAIESNRRAASADAQNLFEMQPQDFGAALEADTQYLAVCAKSQGLTAQQVQALVSQFEAHLQIEVKQHTTFSEFKRHFGRWLPFRDMKQKAEQPRPTVTRTNGGPAPRNMSAQDLEIAEAMRKRFGA